jgi:predicted AAA+ superfamily ATPase
MYIYRELLDKIDLFFADDQPKGLILTGIVGCGKTTLIQELLKRLESKFDVFVFSGDDSRFRQEIFLDSNYINEKIRSRKGKRTFVFVDEVQKSEEIFDAIKIAFDKAQVSFIVSGSNPAFLSTVAKRRLQRRADQMLLLPISLFELGVHFGWVSDKIGLDFSNALWTAKSLDEIDVPNLQMPENLSSVLDQYFSFGGLPLSWIANHDEERLRQIKLVVERGFELIKVENSSLEDVVRTEIAQMNSREFTYKNILERTRTRLRKPINDIIDGMLNHGYLCSKKPLLLFPGKSSYLSVFSYIDPGIVSYLTGVQDRDGFRIEGYVHARLYQAIYNSVSKASLSYFKPHTLDTNGNIRFSPGEIDFVFQSGRRMVPIEVKSAARISEIDTNSLQKFVSDQKVPFGMVVYGGLPQISFQKKLLYWPYWLI